MDFSNITMEATRLKERPDTDFKDAVHWSLVLNGVVTVEYSEGIGHFIKQSMGKAGYMDRCLKKIVMQEALNGHEGVDISNTEAKQRLTGRVKLKGHNIGRSRAEITPPKIEDVLYSLSMDAYAINETFEGWCGDCGYDTDSIKAKQTYDACIEAYQKLKRLGLKHDELAEHFQDY